MKRLTVLAVLVLIACGEDTQPIQGYVEGEYLRMGLPAAGKVVQVSVRRGDQVQLGSPLFALDDQFEQAALSEAKAKLEQAQFQRDNLLTGKRAQEIHAIEAQRAQAESDLRLASLQLRRQEELIKTGYTPQSSLDAARAAFERDRAKAAELTAQLAQAHEGGRTAEIQAADAGVAVAQAGVQQAQWRLSQRVAEAPQAALVEDVLFRVGEEVAAGQPVVSLLPPGNIVLRFFMGPADVARVSSGAELKVACLGCPTDLIAKVTYVAREASYAPPVIYSRDNKDKLVFLVEARPLTPTPTLRPGQPVTLSLPVRQ